MNENDIKQGLIVKVTSAHSTGGMLIKQVFLDARREGAVGEVLDFVPGHGGDVWWVKHIDTPELDVAAYMFTEFEPYEGPPVEDLSPPLPAQTPRIWE